MQATPQRAVCRRRDGPGCTASLDTTLRNGAAQDELELDGLSPHTPAVAAQSKQEAKCGPNQDLCCSHLHATSQPPSTQRATTCCRLERGGGEGVCIVPRGQCTPKMRLGRDRSGAHQIRENAATHGAARARLELHRTITTTSQLGTRLACNVAPLSTLQQNGLAHHARQHLPSAIHAHHGLQLLRRAVLAEPEHRQLSACELLEAKCHAGPVNLTADICAPDVLLDAHHGLANVLKTTVLKYSKDANSEEELRLAKLERLGIKLVLLKDLLQSLFGIDIASGERQQDLRKFREGGGRGNGYTDSILFKG